MVKKRPSAKRSRTVRREVERAGVKLAEARLDSHRSSRAARPIDQSRSAARRSSSLTPPVSSAPPAAVRHASKNTTP